MNKELAATFLTSIEHERDQDIEITGQLLKSLPLSKLVAGGYAINHLVLENIRTGLAGKIYVELGVDNAYGDELNRGDIKVGDIVSIKPSTKKSGSAGKGSKRRQLKKSDDSTIAEELQCNGVVYKMTNTQIVITIQENEEEEATKLYSHSNLYLIKLTNTITYKRMESTMRKFAEFEETPSNNIIQLLMEAKPFTGVQPAADVKFFNQNLNDSQRDAIAFSLTNEISIIHGPPGTGKTYTLVELIKQLVEVKGQRVLVCGPSNVAVDTILERLAKVMNGDLLLRIGHPARLLESNLGHSLDILCKTGDNGSIIRDIYHDIDKTIASTKKLKSYKDRREAWKEVKALRKELRVRERKVVNELIVKAKVIVTTLHGAGSRELCRVYDQVPHLFDTLIIDEVSQSLEPQCWIPLISHYKSNISKLILAGDNKQLPPTIKTEDDANIRMTLETTLFDRLVKIYGDQFKNLLNVQYRMNEEIMKFSSVQMYQNKLKAHDSVATKVLSDLPGVDSSDDTNVPLIWYDTQGDQFPESDESLLSKSESSKVYNIISSKYNENEALQVRDHVIKLLSNSVSQEHIGIIAPYSAQVTYLKSLLRNDYPLIEISTVDGFQGREKEVIILTLVRSNEKFEVGFLREKRRLNVAMTRPKKQLCVVGNIEVLERSNSKYLKSWGEWSEENSEIRYPDIDDLL